MPVSQHRADGLWVPGRTPYRAPGADAQLGPSAITAIALVCIACGVAVVLAEWDALFVGLAVIACLGILVDFRVGVVLLIILMPLSYSELFPHQIAGVTGLNPINILLMGTLGAALLHALNDRNLSNFVPQPLFWLYIVPFLIAGARGSRHVAEIPAFYFMTDTIHFTSSTGFLRDLVVKPILLVAFALLVARAVAKAKNSEKFLVPIAVSVWVMSLMVIVYFVLSGSRLSDIASSSARRFLSPLGMHANDFSRMYVTAYALLLFTWAETRNHLAKLVLLASMGMALLAGVLTFSRGGFAGFVLVMALFLASRRRIGSMIVCLALVATAALFIPDAVYDRASSGFGLGANAISAGRIDAIWIPLIPDVLKSPIFGSGLSSMLWSDAVRTGRSILAVHPHNAYLQTILDMGLVGMVLTGLYLGHLWLRFRRLANDSRLTASERGFFGGAAAGLVAFLVMSVSDGSLTPKPEQVYVWLAVGMMYGHCLRLKPGGQ
jgi:O-antigen ligase